MYQPLEFVSIADDFFLFEMFEKHNALMKKFWHHAQKQEFPVQRIIETKIEHYHRDFYRICETVSRLS